MRLTVVAALSALLAACAGGPRYDAASIGATPVTPAQRGGDQPAQQAAVVAPRTFCPAPAFEVAARRNADSLRTFAFAPFGRDETGWEIYAPALVQLVGSACPPETPAFAERLAAWQGAHGLTGNGEIDDKTFSAVKAELQFRRPFLKARSEGYCPDAAIEETLAQAGVAESRWDKPVKLRPAALAAYRRMVAAARAEAPQVFVQSDTLKIFSAYRSPAYDASRCQIEGNCNGVVRAQCSAHRTGLAMDLMVGYAPGFRADSTDDLNRLYQTRTAAYRWLIANAGRFGFINYPFEPWHWEWTGEPLLIAGLSYPPRPGAPPYPAPVRTYARSSTSAPNPPRPSSPAGPDPLGWLPPDR